MKQVLVDTELMNGNPHLEGTRLSVLDVLMDLQHDGLEATLAATRLTKVEIQGLLLYCRNKQCDEDRSHCGGCTLRLVQDGITSKQEFVDRFSKVRFIDSSEEIEGRGEGTIVLPGTMDQLEEHWRGVRGWEIAGQITEEI